MAGYLPADRTITVLEPTPGDGVVVEALAKHCAKGTTLIYPPGDFWTFNHHGHTGGTGKYDYIVMNPPFTPMAEGFRYLRRCMELSDNIICLLPWLLILNSEKRKDELINFGLVGITDLPRKCFPRTRIQTNVLELQRGYTGPMYFRRFTFGK